MIIYNDDDIHKIHLNKTFAVTINNHKYFYISDTNLRSKVFIEMYQTTYTVHFEIVNTRLCEYPILPHILDFSAYSANNIVEIND